MTNTVHVGIQSYRLQTLGGCILGLFLCGHDGWSQDHVTILGNICIEMQRKWVQNIDTFQLMWLNIDFKLFVIFC